MSGDLGPGGAKRPAPLQGAGSEGEELPPSLQGMRAAMKHFSFSSTGQGQNQPWPVSHLPILHMEKPEAQGEDTCLKSPSKTAVSSLSPLPPVGWVIVPCLCERDLR